jgi:hypothetical protein
MRYDRRNFVAKLQTNKFAIVVFYPSLYRMAASNSNNWLWIGGGIAVLLLLMSKKTAGAAPATDTSTAGGAFDLSQFSSQYGADNVQRLNNLYAVLLNKGLTSFQIQLLLSQALEESGLFNTPNLNNIDNFNNFTGIKGNSRYAAAPGSMYVSYPSIDAFVDDWITILNFDFHGAGAPIDAISVADFVRRLNINKYFESSPSVYQANVQYYYDMLTNSMQ